MLEVCGKVIGQVALQEIPDLDDCDDELEELEVTMLAVAQGWQGRGLAKRLMEAAEAEAARLGCTWLRLQVLKSRTHAYPHAEKLIAFYQKLGFQPTATGDFAAQYPETRPFLLTEVDFTIYYKLLEPSALARPQKPVDEALPTLLTVTHGARAVKICEKEASLCMLHVISV